MKYVRNDSFYHSILDEEMCLFDPEIAKYHNLNKVGTLIWEILDNPKDINNIVNFLTDNYEVNKHKCLKETENFLKLAVNEKIFLTIT